MATNVAQIYTINEIISRQDSPGHEETRYKKYIKKPLRKI